MAHTPAGFSVAHHGAGVVGAFSRRPLGADGGQFNLYHRYLLGAAGDCGPGDFFGLSQVCANAAIAAGLDVVFGENSIKLSGEEVGEVIRHEEISSGASQVAALPAVRAALLFRQRIFRQSPGLVADGRDMASVVFPDAQTKVFLTATAEVRAERRYKQLIEKGIAASILPLLLDLRARDERDSQRSVAPLQQDNEAELLDTTNLTIEHAVAQVLSWSKLVL